MCIVSSSSLSVGCLCVVVRSLGIVLSLTQHLSECGGRLCRLGFFSVLVKAFVFGGVCLEGLKISGAVKCSFFLFWVLLGFEEGKTCFFFLGGGKQGLEKTLSKVGICFLSKVSLNNLGFSFIGLNYLQI